MDFQAILELAKAYIINLIDSLNLQTIAYSLIMAVSGLVIIILARRLTRIIKKNNDIDDEDKFMLTLKSFGLLLLFVALLMVIFQSLQHG